jgi:glycine/D-amino acid oxidase-like deaminating enzyme
MMKTYASSQNIETADVVIIGGGIIGAACGYYLSGTGLDVHLVERTFPGSGTSRACDGLILLWDKTGAELELGQASVRLWEQLEESLDEDFGFERSGTILLAETEGQLQAGREKAALLRDAGQAAEVLLPKQLLTLEPELAPGLAGGVFFPDDLQVEPRRATLTLLAAAKRRGLQLHTGTEIVDIHREGNRSGSTYTLTTNQGQFSAPTIVCAAGVWSNQIAAMVGVELPTRPRKGHILVTGKRPGLIRHPLLEGGYVTTVESDAQDLQIALVVEMTTSGTLLIGSSREFRGYDREVSLDVIQAIADRAKRFLPRLGKTPIIRSYAGLRPWSPDGLPLVGHASLPGFYLATGHEGAGICLAPVTGKLLADTVTGESFPPEAEGVSPKRFQFPAK